MADYEPDQQSPTSHTYFIPIKSVTTDVANEHLQRLYLYFTTYGAAFLLVGLIAILLPLVFGGISIPQMIAWIQIIGGAVALLHFFLVFGAPGTTSFLGFGILHLGVGLWFVILTSVTKANTFAWITTGWFLLHGLLKFMMAFQVQSITSWPALLSAAIISVILGFLNLAFAGAYGDRIVAIFFGADLALTGIAFFLISLMAYLASGAAASLEPLLREHGQSTTGSDA